MAVTSRNLHQPVPRRFVGATQGKLQWGSMASYVRIALVVLLAYGCLAAAAGWGKIWFDDLRYGRPRTQQISGMVGHNEGNGEPTHFLAMNLNRRVVVIELPGGDVTKAQTLQGPYLFGANEDLTPVGLRLQDINDDGKSDVVLSVKNEKIIYINTGESFRLINAEERQQLKRVP